MLEVACFGLSMAPAGGMRAVCRAQAALPHAQYSHQRLVWQQQAGAAASASRSRQLPARTGSIAAVSTPERLTVSDRTPAPPPPEVEVRVIGIGTRGANALTKLVERGKVGAAWRLYSTTCVMLCAVMGVCQADLDACLRLD